MMSVKIWCCAFLLLIVPTALASTIPPSFSQKILVPQYCTAEIILTNSVITFYESGVDKADVYSQIDTANNTSSDISDETAAHAKRLADLVYGLAPTTQDDYKTLYITVIEYCNLKYRHLRKHFKDYNREKRA